MIRLAITPLLLVITLIVQPILLCQSHTAKIQIQGDDMNPMLSESWTRGTICTKRDGIEMLDKLWDQLSPSQKKEREDAYTEAKNFISRAPINGIEGGSSWSRSFTNSQTKVRRARIDIEIYRGAAFSNDRHVVYIKVMGPDMASSKIREFDDKYIIGKKEGIDKLNSLWGSLNSTQKDVRKDAYEEAVRYVNSSPVNGRTGPLTKEFQDSQAKKGEKIVIVIDKGAAFSD